MTTNQDPLTPETLRKAIEHHFATTPSDKVVEAAERLRPPPQEDGSHKDE